MSAPPPPAGWYPALEGNQRYWDGTQWTGWTRYVVPDPSAVAGRTPAGGGDQPTGPRVWGVRSLGPAAWLGWGGLVLTALLGAASSGLGGFFGMGGIYVLVVAIIALVRGRVEWARLRGRVAGSVALGAAFALFAVAGATAGPTPSAQVGAPSDSLTIRTMTESPESSTPPRTTTAQPATTTPAPTTSSAGAPAAQGTALAALAQVPVKGRAPKSGYSREAFGQAWADVDRNGCDTRNDILRRDLKGFTLKAGTNGCLVLSGTLVSPYTGKTISFVRGQGTSTAVQIDHVVALSDAWQKGGQQLDLTTRTAFANDPLNLLAVDGAANQAKGDGDAATWLPPSKSYRCAHVAQQVAVKIKYQLWVTAAEHDAISRILQSCPNQTLPTSTAVPLGGGIVKITTAAPKPTSSPQPAKPPAGLDPMFGTCKATKAAGYGPYYAGEDPEYDWYRDADSDGIVCE